MGMMPANPIQLLGAGLVVTVGLAATSGAVSAPATGSRHAADAAQGKSKIAFISRGLQRRPALYVVSADGSGQRRLTGSVSGRTPEWSPDGRRIAFEAGGIYVVNADGSGQRMLARRGSDPAWSPDGRTIAFMWRFHIYVMNADGTEHRALMRLWNGKRASLAWSPDGRKLAFLAGGGPVVDDLLRGGCGAPPVYCFNLYVVNSDGSGLRNLTSKLGAGGYGPGTSLASDPVWSPDGRKIAFVQLSKRLGVYVVNADGSGVRNLTPKPMGAGYAAPAWSPDGRKIAFVSDRDDNSEVYVMNANGSGQRSLTRNPAFDDDPAWSPDGRLIAFRSTREGNTDIYIMNADGSGQRNLTRSPANEGWFAWSPGQKR